MKKQRDYDRVVNGVPAPRLRADNVIWAGQEDRIQVVNSFSPIRQRKRAALTAQVVNREMRYDFPIYSWHDPLDERNVHLLLYIAQNRVVGLLIVEKRKDIWIYSWDTYESRQGKKLNKVPPIWSIGFVWVHKNFRRQGIAQRLLKTALRHLKINPKWLGWYAPFSGDGKAFIKKLYPQLFWVAK